MVDMDENSERADRFVWSEGDFTFGDDSEDEPKQDIQPQNNDKRIGAVDAEANGE